MPYAEVEQNEQVTMLLPPAVGARMKIPEIAQRLNVGRLAVYDLLEQGIIPGIRLRKKWIVTRHAYLEWERNAGRKVA